MLNVASESSKLPAQMQIAMFYPRPTESECEHVSQDSISLSSAQILAISL